VLDVRVFSQFTYQVVASVGVEDLGNEGGVAKVQLIINHRHKPRTASNKIRSVLTLLLIVMRISAPKRILMNGAVSPHPSHIPSARALAYDLTS